MKIKNYLTNREFEVLNLLSVGYSTPEISQKLYLSTETIKTYRKRLLEKLEARNVAHLIRLAYEKNILFSNKSKDTINHQFNPQFELVA